MTRTTCSHSCAKLLKQTMAGVKCKTVIKQPCAGCTQISQMLKYSTGCRQAQQRWQIGTLTSRSSRTRTPLQRPCSFARWSTLTASSSSHQHGSFLTIKTAPASKPTKRSTKRQHTSPSRKSEQKETQLHCLRKCATYRTLSRTKRLSCSATLTSHCSLMASSLT